MLTSLEFLGTDDLIDDLILDCDDAGIVDIDVDALLTAYGNFLVRETFKHLDQLDQHYPLYFTSQYNNEGSRFLSWQEAKQRIKHNKEYAIDFLNEEGRKLAHIMPGLSTPKEDFLGWSDPHLIVIRKEMAQFLYTRPMDTIAKITRLTTLLSSFRLNHARGTYEAIHPFLFKEPPVTALNDGELKALYARVMRAKRVDLCPKFLRYDSYFPT